jgi:xanthine dehydrogenase YagS FAD-binding subunit
MAGPTGPAFFLSMTHPFVYRRAASLDDAAQQLAQPRAVSLGGGTDLLVTIAERLAAPDTLVDLRTIPDSAEITTTDSGGMRIGASARIADVARHAAVRERYPALAQACEVVATPALRHMGTIGGNLCQRPRCWYFRRGIPCHKNGGASCPAVDGENQYLAIVDGGPCYIVHPSDAAVALAALDATLEIVSRGGSRRVPIADFYVLPRERMDHETILELGGVAPRPWRVSSSVEEDVASGGLDEDTVGILAERALYDARPLSGNGYKVELAASLLRDAMRELGAAGGA